VGAGGRTPLIYALSEELLYLKKKKHHPHLVLSRCSIVPNLKLTRLRQKVTFWQQLYKIFQRIKELKGEVL